MSIIGNQLQSTNFVTDVFTGDASTTAFTLSRTPASVTSIIAFIDGVKQASIGGSGAYTLVGTTLNFTAAPPNNAVVEVIHLGVQSLVNVPSSATVTANSLAPELRAINAEQFTANGTGTTFTLSAAPISSNSLIVTANGVVQYDYSVSGATLILNFTPVVNTLIRAAGMGNILTTGTITDDSVSTAKLQLNSVTTAKIADGSVTGPKIGLTAINANNIVDASITGAKIALGTITGDDIAVGQITGNLLTANCVSGNNIVANTITANLFNTTIYASNNDIIGISANANTFGNTIIIVAGNTSTISVGDIVAGANVFPGTTVLSFNSPPSNRSNITVSKALAGSNTNTAVAFYSSTKVISPGIAGPGLSKAWVNFDPSSGSSAIIRASYNISSVTYNGTGDYTINFTTSFANLNYLAIGISSVKIGLASTLFVPNWTPPGTETASSTGSFKCGVVRSDNTGAVDPVYVYVSFFNF